MSFLDRFKRQPSEENAPAQEVKVPPVTVPARLADTAGSPRSRDAGLPAFQPVEPRLRESAAHPEPKHEMQLELSDFLPRIAPQLLHDGPHADATKLTFDIAELAERIARGQTTIRLAEIYRRVPEIFREEIPAYDEAEIRFPWQKVMRMLAGACAVPAAPVSGGLTAAGAAALAETFRNRRVARNPILGFGEATDSRATPSPEAAENGSEPGSAAAELAAGAAPNSPLPDDEKLTREELLRTRDAMRAQFRRVRGEHERQLALFAQERQKTNGERQRFVAEMVRLKKEADDKEGQIRFEKEVAAKTADTLAKVREANAALARQVAETAAGAKAGPERPPQESPREADELRHRMTTLESNQRDTALELGRELEAKRKLERQLATAERLAGESAAKIEEALTAARHDFEMTQRKSEADSARALQEAHEKFAAASVARERLASASAAETSDAWEGRAAAQFEADIGNYRKRIKSLLGEREALTREKAALAEQLATGSGESAQLSAAHAAAQKEIAAQTTTWAAERAKLADDLAAARQSHESETTAHRELRAAHEKIAADQSGTIATLAELRAELEQLRAAHAALQNDSEKLRAAGAAQTAAATAERAALADELAAARQAHETAQTAHGTLRAVHEKAEAERTALAAQLANAQAAHALAFAALTDESADLGAKARALHTELADRKTAHATATEALRTATSTHAEATARQSAQHDKLLGEKTALETQFADAERELAKLRARVQQSDVTVAGAEVAIRHHDEAIAKLREQHGQTLAARATEYASALAAAHAEKEEVIGALQARHEEDLRGSTDSGSRLAGEIARLTDTAAAAQRESAAAAQSLAAANAEADRKFATYQRERDGLLAERRLLAAELEAAKDALKAQSVVFARDLKRARQQRDATAPQHLDATLSDEPGDEPDFVPPRTQQARKDRGENQAGIIGIAPARDDHAAADDSGRLKIQRVRPVPIRPPQVQAR